ncbi:TPA: hypothetical protein ONV50_001778 [Enterococcus faecium]|uniref:hypothetical protein n=1 Tax=Enterococcus TaxID=1350 RepID=UPI000667FA72|nr:MULTISPECIES: hypothetical protein [Enterococcus]AQT58101.1 hypothetical protein BVA20_02699 [Enterococcus faecium]AQY29482.1 hypothetical protein B4W80_11385 [Enterococcus faecium]AQY31733.1 hypothetical protein B4W81_06940 [Enterococcus faecium]MBQ1101725.1 hypothetical protein [Enterococcus faecium]MBQ1127637.1 hypothetical protein [Enterococcus faecium]
MNWLKNEAELYVFHEEMQEKHLVPNVRNYLFWLEEKNDAQVFGKSAQSPKIKLQLTSKQWNEHEWYIY